MNTPIGISAIVGRSVQLEARGDRVSGHGSSGTRPQMRRRLELAVSAHAHFAHHRERCHHPTPGAMR